MIQIHFLLSANRITLTDLNVDSYVLNRKQDFSH